MKRFYLFNLLIITLTTIGLLSGCNKTQEVETVEKEVRPVKTILVKSPDAGGIRHFPAHIDANKRAELSFRVSGKVNELLVKEGDIVAQGDIIAKLDATDFKIEVNDKNALFTRASKDYKRGQKLVKEGHLSKMDFDKLEASFLSAKAALNLAKQQLNYTELKAPFGGIVAQRYIQNFEEIQTKQKIIILNDNNILEVKFSLPENLILRLRIKNSSDTKGDVETKENRRLNIPVFALFQSQKDKEYPLTFKEASTKADTSTQTFSVTFTMPNPVDVTILPGMTATVKIDLSHYIEMDNVFYLPVSAVIADVALKGTVWAVNEKTMLVEPISIEVGKMRGNQVEVKKGIKAGQRIVTAGVPFLYKDLKVSLMMDSEQAKDNINHKQPIMPTNKDQQL
ncbi:MAG: efflux RND transporter periplasmic adaptor subunit [Gammaproteobacteria bacterium]|nr:efflux RND transporter periplasmic adaptor subunit [Gammaproteobacteria bacterium]